MFDVTWEEKFLCIEFPFAGASCLVCGTELAARKQSLLHHYERYHKEYNKYTGPSRLKIIKKLKVDYERKLFAFIHKRKNSRLSQSQQQIKASFIISYNLAKKCRPLSDGVIFKDLSVSVLDCFGTTGKIFAEMFKNIPLSHKTIVRRIESINDVIFSNTCNRIMESKYYSIFLDAITDIHNICQLIISVKSVDENFYTCEEMLSLIPLKGNVTGEKIFEAVDSSVFRQFGTSKLSAVCTNGAKNMIDERNGFIGRLSQNEINVLSFHCTIHQQALFANIANVEYTMEITTKIIKKIKSENTQQNNKKFKTLLQDLETEYGDLRFYSNNRWLSEGKWFKRLFDLRSEIKEFLDDNDKSSKVHDLQMHFNDSRFLQNFGLLTDITQYLNQLNLSLQEKNKHVFDLISTIEELKMYLINLRDELENNDLTSFPNMSIICLESEIVPEWEECCDTLNLIIESINGQFSDLVRIKSILNLYKCPFTCDIEDLSDDIKDEMIAMRIEIMSPSKSKTESRPQTTKKQYPKPLVHTKIETQFWSQVDETKYPNTKNKILWLHSIIASTSVSESSFSTLSLTQNKHRTALSNKHIESLIRIKNSNDEIDFDTLAEKLEEINRVNMNGIFEKNSQASTAIDNENKEMKIKNNPKCFMEKTHEIAM